MPPTLPRKLPIWGYLLIAGLGAALVMLGAQLLVGAPPPGQPPKLTQVIALTFAAIVVAVWAVWLSILVFRSLDEFQQEAGRFAWYWGGSLGMMVSVIGYVFVTMGGLHWLGAALPGGPQPAFRDGYFLAIGCQLAGFVAVRLWWQAAKR